MARFSDKVVRPGEEAFNDQLIWSTHYFGKTNNILYSNIKDAIHTGLNLSNDKTIYNGNIEISIRINLAHNYFISDELIAKVGNIEFYGVINTSMIRMVLNGRDFYLSRVAKRFKDYWIIGIFLKYDFSTNTFYMRDYTNRSDYVLGNYVEILKPNNFTINYKTIFNNIFVLINRKNNAIRDCTLSINNLSLYDTSKTLDYASAFYDKYIASNKNVTAAQNSFSSSNGFRTSDYYNQIIYDTSYGNYQEAEMEIYRKSYKKFFEMFTNKTSVDNAFLHYHGFIIKKGIIIDTEYNTFNNSRKDDYRIFMYNHSGSYNE